ncbi:hypothetical protein B0H63DRAFT_466393 [Podospora didyma]|uniref:Amidohydrolase-related domain-containing protein n=1 Tax=Podospora didyma TaxID=330526 RepID=A0AAE0P0E7_9PEZI|nr:hypothetical protein B0H63DRAFT_466393 [Podospora didyma]
MTPPSLTLLLCSLVITVTSCAFDNGSEGSSPPAIDYGPITAQNIANRQLNRRHISPAQRTALINVRVFDGLILRLPSTILIDGNRIGPSCHHTSGNTNTNPCGASAVYDAQGKTLLPGLMDSHTHPRTISDLTALTRAGVTTIVNANCPDPALCASLASQPGLTEIVATASFIATTPFSAHAVLVGLNNTDKFINSIGDAPTFVSRQIAQGADFIKIIGSAPGPGLSQDEQTVLVQAANAQYPGNNRGPRTVMHASSTPAYAQALEAKADQIHHSTLDAVLSDDLVREIVRQGTVVCPTLTVMRKIANSPLFNSSSGNSFAAAAQTVAKLHAASTTLGRILLAGTDASLEAAAPVQVPFGSSLHDELENLVVEGGLSPVQALNAATLMPARVFGLAGQRGAVREGLLADLVLVDGDPTVDIKKTRNVVKVWVRGVEFVE